MINNTKQMVENIFEFATIKKDIERRDFLLKWFEYPWRAKTDGYYKKQEELKKLTMKVLRYETN